MIYTKQEWYTPGEVVTHNTAVDCWVSLNGKVRDLTSWLQQQLILCSCTKDCSCAHKNWICDVTCTEYCKCFKLGFVYCDAKRLAVTVLAYAGKDVSHWFKGDEWLRYTHPLTGTTTVFHQHGPGHRQPVVPSTRWRPYQKPWWLDESNVVGKVTEKARPIMITNTLTGSSVTLEVCSEETLYQILMRYLPHNGHVASYTWRYDGRRLNMEKNLADNGIPDERERFVSVGLAENFYVPNILLYYNDDFTEDPRKNICQCED